jgi:hypothetical protein
MVVGCLKNTQNTTQKKPCVLGEASNTNYVREKRPTQLDLHPATGPGPGSLIPQSEQADPAYIMRDKRII